MLMMQVFKQVVWQMGMLAYSPVFWISVGIVYLQIRWNAVKKEKMFQIRREPIMFTVCITVLSGIVGGILCSVLLLFFGVSVNYVSLKYLWGIALLLLMIRQRFLCFAYSGGCLVLCNDFCGWPDIQAEQLLIMIAVLHGIEAFLVLTTGHINALPIYLRNVQGQITSGFLLQMAWPLPIMMLFAMQIIQFDNTILWLPEWWPFIDVEFTYNDENCDVIYLMIPVLTVLGYSDVVIKHNLMEKTRKSAVLLMLYSGSLLFLVLLSEKCGLRLFVPAFFALLGHEAIIFYGKRDEMRGTDFFIAPAYGVALLDVQRNSPAAKAGLRRNDWIVAIDNQMITDRQRFLELQYRLSTVVTVDYWRAGKKRQCQINMKKWEQLGLITVPDDRCNVCWMLEEDKGIVKFLYKKLEKTLKKEE